MQWKQVLSSNVDEIAYDEEGKRLLVKWKRGGKTSAYLEVPSDVADKVMNSWSIGSALNDEIKPNFGHRYV